MPLQDCRKSRQGRAPDIFLQHPPLAFCSYPSNMVQQLVELYTKQARNCLPHTIDP